LRSFAAHCQTVRGCHDGRPSTTRYGRDRLAPYRRGARLQSLKWQYTAQCARRRRLHHPGRAVSHEYISVTIPSHRHGVEPKYRYRPRSMRSLKRSATSDSDSNVSQKRKCSNPSFRPSTILTRDANTAASPKFQRRKPAQHMLHAEVPVHCIHKHASACSLLMKMCCSCADKRPITHFYPMYVDGRGIGPTDDRSLHYCFGCQGTSRN